MKNSYKCLIYILISFAIISCDNKLTREEASKIIVANFPRKVYNQFTYGRLVGLQSYVFGSYTEKELQKENMLTITKVNEDGSFLNWITVDYSVPEELKKYIYKIYQNPNSQNPNEQVCLVQIGEQSFVEVTGINEINKQEAEVEYTWTFTNSTPYAKVFKSYILFNDNQRRYSTKYYYNSKVVQTEKIKMKKFDDGWRLSEPFSYPVMYKNATDPVDEYPQISSYNSGNNGHTVDTIASFNEKKSTSKNNINNPDKSQLGYYVVNGSANRKIYFYNAPDVNTRRKAYFSSIETVYVQKIQNEFGYVEFTNENGQTSTGWLNMIELQHQ